MIGMLYTPLEARVFGHSRASPLLIRKYDTQLLVLVVEIQQ